MPICGRCPSKDSCSPTPGPREITRPVDPWPYSDAGRFHRGVGLVIACVGVFIPVLLMVAFHAAGDLIVLGTTTVVVIVAGVLPLARHLWSTPDNAPAHLPHVGSQEYQEAEEARRSASGTGPVPVSISARPSGYRSVREAAEAIATAQARAAATGRTVHVSFLADSDGASEGGRRDCRLHCLRGARAASRHRPAHPQARPDHRRRARVGWNPRRGPALVVLGVERGHRHHTQMIRAQP